MNMICVYSVNYSFAYLFNYLEKEWTTEIARLEEQRDQLEAELQKVGLTFHIFMIILLE